MKVKCYYCDKVNLIYKPNFNGMQNNKCEYCSRYYSVVWMSRSQVEGYGFYGFPLPIDWMKDEKRFPSMEAYLKWVQSEKIKVARLNRSVKRGA